MRSEAELARSGLAAVHEIPLTASCKPCGLKASSYVMTVESSPYCSSNIESRKKQ